MVVVTGGEGLRRFKEGVRSWDRLGLGLRTLALSSSVIITSSILSITVLSNPKRVD